MCLGQSLTDGERVFTGAVGVYPDDSFYYMALGPAEMADGQKILGEDKFMRAEGDLFINPIGNLIAFLAYMLSISNTDAFLIFRMLAATLLLISFHCLTTLFIESPVARIFSVVLFLFGAGYHGCVNGMGCSWTLSAPEMNMFVAMIGEYYIPLANALFILYMYSLIRFLRTGAKWLLQAMGVLMLLSGAVYIYGMLASLLISFAVSVYHYFKDNRFDAIAAFLFSLIGSLPPILYYSWLFLFHMDDAARNDGWVIGPSPSETFLTYIWVLVPAMFFPLALRLSGGAEWRRYAPLLIWVAVTLTLTLIPPPVMPFQVQAHIGLTAPLTIMASASLLGIGLSGLSSGRFKRFIPLICSFLVLALAAWPNVYFYRNVLARLHQQEFPEFVNRDAMNVMNWAEEHVPQESVVVVGDELARMFAGISGCRVFYRNPMPGQVTSESEAIKFWSDQLLMGLCSNELLHTRFKATHVFITPGFQEQSIKSGISSLDCMDKIYQSGDFSLWCLK